MKNVVLHPLTKMQFEQGFKSYYIKGLFNK